MVMGISSLTTAFLIAIRLGIIFLFSPIEAIRLLPLHTRLVLLLMISLLITTIGGFSQAPPDSLSLALSGVAECCNGLVLSMSLYAAFGVFHLAGQLIDTQMGLNSLAILNPTGNEHYPFSGRLFIMLAVLFFFATDGHHLLIQGFVMSFKIIKPGQLLVFHGMTPIIQACSLMFSMALLVASPIVVGLLVIDVAGAIITRNMPQISTYFLILPIKIVLGLVIFGLLLNYINPIMEKIFQLCLQLLVAVMS